jgi:hypothetical protein
MPITFACPRCGKSYSVDPALAGRKGKCSACGRPMTIPTFYDDGDDTIATEGYDLSEPVAAAVVPEEQTVFVAAGRDPDVRSDPRRRERPSVGTRPGRIRPEDDEPFHVRHRAALIGAPLLFLAALGLIAAIVKNGTLIAACVLAGLGALLILIGYTVGLWAAFREDSLYGFFYFVFPLYTAYYILTRFEDLWPWFLAMTVGAGLVTVGATIAESKLRDRPEAAAWHEDRPPGMARPTSPATDPVPARDLRWA